MADAAKLREILKTEYGINNDEEFEAAVEKSAGINLGIFTNPLNERSDCCAEEPGAGIVA